MKRLPWTKFQDFYLRLGFLRALVASLGSERRSVQNELIVKRLETPLFDRADAYPSLWSVVGPLMTWHVNETDASSGKPGIRPFNKNKKEKYAPVAEALLVATDWPSLLYAVTRPTAYKILDWGRDVGFVGQGNQITERGLVLRSLFDAEAASLFQAKGVEAWNPFELSLIERMFFLYHLTEIDGVILQVADELGDVEEGAHLEITDAARFVSKALSGIVSSAERNLPPSEIPAFRVAKALADTIAEEVGLGNQDLRTDLRRRLSKPSTPALRLGTSSHGSTAARRSHKNADHQTVPRFEQLVDLGLLAKPGGANDLKARRRWRYTPTDMSRRWTAARKLWTSPEKSFHWHGFAAAATAAYLGHAETAGEQTKDIVSYLWRAYSAVRRPVGHSPLDSIALTAMLMAATDGVIIEMADFHRLMLTIKTTGVLQGEVFFASGNALDRMFISLRPDFEQRAVAELPSVLPRTETDANDTEQEGQS